LDKVKAILDKLYESNPKLFYRKSEWRKRKWVLILKFRLWQTNYSE
jgi:hypothetical protein